MRHIVMFSGGVGSWATAKRVAQQVGTADLALLFADVIIEDEDLYRSTIETAAVLSGRLPEEVADLARRALETPDLWHMDERKAHLSQLREDTRRRLPLLHWFAEGRHPFEVFRDVRYLGNTRIDPCSKVLKRDWCRRWLDQFAITDGTTIYLGIDWTEIHRFEKAKPHWAPWSVSAPLCDPPYTDKDGLLADLQATGIQPQRLYDLGFPHANCGGGCVKAGLAQWRHLLKTMPERYAWWEHQEQEMRTFLSKDVSILRDRSGSAKCKPCRGAGLIDDQLCGGCDGTGRATRPLTLRELRENTALQVDLFDWGGCGCFSDVDEVVVGSAD